jgi:hypothetical protein
MTPTRRHHAVLRGLRRSRLAAVVLLGVLCGSKAGVAAQAPNSATENQVKAAAVYNVIAFTDWPTEAFPSSDAPLVLGILGEGPIATLLDQFIRGEKWRGHPIVIERYASIREMQNCHVLFVARSQAANWSTIREGCGDRPILAVSDGDGFAAHGGHVQLVIADNKLRILVNLAATRAGRLQLSSGLLHLATIIGPAPDAPREPHSGLLPAGASRFCVALAD